MNTALHIFWITMWVILGGMMTHDWWTGMPSTFAELLLAMGALFFMVLTEVIFLIEEWDE